MGRQTAIAACTLTCISNRLRKSDECGGGSSGGGINCCSADDAPLELHADVLGRLRWCV
jgi:hypothetical protein